MNIKFLKNRDAHFYNKIILFVIWIMMAVILSVVFAVMHLYHSNGVKSFANNGFVYDVPTDQYINFSTEQGASDSQGVWTAYSNDFFRWISLNKISKKKLYLYINLSDLSRAHITVRVYLYNLKLDDPILFEEDVQLVEGDNYIELDKLTYSRLGLRLFNQEGVSFKINDIELRSHKKVSDLKVQILKRFVVIFLLFLGCTGIFLKLVCKTMCKIDTYNPLDNIQKIYISIGNIIYRISALFTENVKAILRCVIFFGLMLYYNLAYNKIIIHYSVLQKYIVSILGIAFLIVFSIDKKLEKKRWNKRIAYFWAVMCLMMCVSDLFVKKQFMFEGIILLFLFGFATFVIYNNGYYHKILRDLYRAVHIYFICSTLFCLLCRPDINARYLGTFTYSTAFSRYELLIALVALVCLLKSINENQKIGYTIFYIVELIISVFFIWKTQTRTALGALLLIILLAGAMQILICKREQRQKKLVFVVVLGILLTPIIFIGMEVSVNRLPALLNTTIEFKNDTVEIETSKNLVYAEEINISENRFTRTLSMSSLEQITSGRTIFWKAYLREMNWFGHKYNAKVLGRRQHSHCAFLQIPYQFGVLTVIPYLFFIYFIVVFSTKKMLTYVINKKEDSIFLFGIVVIFVLNAMFQPVEMLFSGYIWFVFYLLGGIFLFE